VQIFSPNGQLQVIYITTATTTTTSPSIIITTFYAHIQAAHDAFRFLFDSFVWPHLLSSAPLLLRYSARSDESVPAATRRTSFLTSYNSLRLNLPTTDDWPLPNLDLSRKTLLSTHSPIPSTTKDIELNTPPILVVYCSTVSLFPSHPSAPSPSEIEMQLYCSWQTETPFSPATAVRITVLQSVKADFEQKCQLPQRLRLPPFD
jgi:hypothetical protein